MLLARWSVVVIQSPHRVVGADAIKLWRERGVAPVAPLDAAGGGLQPYRLGERHVVGPLQYPPLKGGSVAPGMLGPPLHAVAAAQVAPVAVEGSEYQLGDGRDGRVSALAGAAGGRPLISHRIPESVEGGGYGVP